MSIFDGLAEIFTDTFGETVIYAPVSGPEKTICAIWSEEFVPSPFDGVDTDGIIAEIHLRESDVSEPREGDIVTRSRDGRVRKLVPPFRPDGKGLVVCALAR